MSPLEIVVGALCALVALIVLVTKKLVTDEVAGYVPIASARLIRAAARQLPETAREQCEAKWLAQVASYSDRPLSGFLFAVRIRFAAKATANELRAHEARCLPSAGPGPSVPSAAATSNTEAPPPAAPLHRGGIAEASTESDPAAADERDCVGRAESERAAPSAQRSRPRVGMNRLELYQSIFQTLLPKTSTQLSKLFKREPWSSPVSNGRTPTQKPADRHEMSPELKAMAYFMEH